MANTLHHNIAKSAFRHGEYIGYCNGAQKIRRGGLGWQTYGLASSEGTAIFVSDRTLSGLGKKLENIK